MDIKAAFDTIKQDKMLEVVSALLDQVSYSVLIRGGKLMSRITITA
jgi:hypothetical protein